MSKKNPPANTKNKKKDDNNKVFINTNKISQQVWIEMAKTGIESLKRIKKNQQQQRQQLKGVQQQLKCLRDFTRKMDTATSAKSNKKWWIQNHREYIQEFMWILTKELCNEPNVVLDMIDTFFDTIENTMVHNIDPEAIANSKKEEEEKAKKEQEKKEQEKKELETKEQDKTNIAATNDEADNNNNQVDIISNDNNKEGNEESKVAEQQHQMGTNIIKDIQYVIDQKRKEQQQQKQQQQLKKRQEQELLVQRYKKKKQEEFERLVNMSKLRTITYRSSQDTNTTTNHSNNTDDNRILPFQLATVNLNRKQQQVPRSKDYDAIGDDDDDGDNNIIYLSSYLDSINQLQSWHNYGIIEESTKYYASQVLMASPDTTASTTSSKTPSTQQYMEDKIFCILGLTSEYSPIKHLLSRGAHVIGITKKDDTKLQPFLQNFVLNTKKKDNNNTHFKMHKQSILQIPTLKNENTILINNNKNSATTTTNDNEKEKEIDNHEDTNYTDVDLFCHIMHIGQWIIDILSEKQNQKKTLVISPLINIDDKTDMRIDVAMDAIIQYVIKNSINAKIQIVYYISNTVCIPVPSNDVLFAKKLYEQYYMSSLSPSIFTQLTDYYVYGLELTNALQEMILKVEKKKEEQQQQQTTNQNQYASLSGDTTTATTTNNNYINSSHSKDDVFLLNAFPNIPIPNYALCKLLSIFRCLQINYRGTNNKNNSHVSAIPIIIPVTRTRNIQANSNIMSFLSKMIYYKPLISFEPEIACNLLTLVMLHKVYIKNDDDDNFRRNTSLATATTTAANDKGEEKEQAEDKNKSLPDVNEVKNNKLEQQNQSKTKLVEITNPNKNMWSMFWDGAIHGGIWTCPYTIDSIETALMGPTPPTYTPTTTTMQFNLPFLSSSTAAEFWPKDIIIVPSESQERK